MKKIISYLFILVSCLPVLGQNASGQDEKLERENYSRLVDAVSCYNNREIDKSVSILGTILSADPGNDGAHYYMALCKVLTGDLDSAEEHFKTASSIDGSNFWYRYRLAKLYAYTGRPELTVVMYEKLLEDFPKKSELYYDLIDIYMSQKQSDEALETLDKIETVFGRNDATAMTRFQLLGNLGRQQEAFESLEKYNREYSSPQVLATLAEYQMSMYNDSTALALYDEALDIEPGFPLARIGKAEVYRMTGKYDRYFPMLQSFMADDGINPAAKADYLKALVQKSDPRFLKAFSKDIDSLVATSVAVHPKDSTLALVEGMNFYATGRLDDARRSFRRNMENWPDSPGLTAAYMELLMYASDWEAVSVEGRKAFERFPQDAVFLEMASSGDFRLNRYDAVLGACDTLLAVARDSATVLSTYSTMGDIYHLKGESGRAYKSYGKALKLNPDYLPVLNNYAYYLSVEGRKLKKAYTMSKRTVELDPDNSTYLDTFGWILHLQGKDVEAKPVFKHAMLYGGKESAVILDHYAEVLYALGEYDLAYVYWNQAVQKNRDGEITDLDERIRKRRNAASGK